MPSVHLPWWKSRRALRERVSQRTRTGIPLVEELKDGLLTLMGIPNSMKERLKRFDELADVAKSLLSCIEGLPEGTKVADLPAALQSDLSQLRTAIKETQQSLEDRSGELGETSQLKNLSQSFQDTELLSSCQESMKRALEHFTAASLIDIRTRVARVEANVTRLVESPPSVVRSVARLWSIPPSPQILYGRESEIANICTILLRELNARLAILGPPSIGKTTLAEAVINHSDVRQRFGPRRFWVPCDLSAAADGVSHFQDQIAQLPLAFPNQTSSLSSHLQLEPHTAPCLVVLDNLDRIWDNSDPLRLLQVEAVLGHLASVPSLSLIVTMRGTVRPRGISWTRPVLPPLSELNLRASVELFLDASGKSLADDELNWGDDVSFPEWKSPSTGVMLSLLHKLEGVPLAITLMAHLAQTGTDENQLLLRWEKESTSMLTQRGTTLHSLDLSIKMSLESPRLTSKPDAVALLNLLAFLDPSHLLPILEYLILSSPTAHQSYEVLLELGLVRSIRIPLFDCIEPAILAPIRTFLRQRDGNMAPYFEDLVQFCVADPAKLISGSLFSMAASKQVASVVEQALTLGDQREIIARTALMTSITWLGFGRSADINDLSGLIEETVSHKGRTWYGFVKQAYNTAVRNCPSGATRICLELLLFCFRSRSQHFQVEDRRGCIARSIEVSASSNSILPVAVHSIILSVKRDMIGGPTGFETGLATILNLTRLFRAIPVSSQYPCNAGIEDALRPEDCTLIGQLVLDALLRLPLPFGVTYEGFYHANPLKYDKITFDCHLILSTLEHITVCRSSSCPIVLVDSVAACRRALDLFRSVHMDNVAACRRARDLFESADDGTSFNAQQFVTYLARLCDWNRATRALQTVLKGWFEEEPTMIIFFWESSKVVRIRRPPTMRSMLDAEPEPIQRDSERLYSVDELARIDQLLFNESDKIAPSDPAEWLRLVGSDISQWDNCFAESFLLQLILCLHDRLLQEDTVVEDVADGAGAPFGDLRSLA